MYSVQACGPIIQYLLLSHLARLGRSFPGIPSWLYRCIDLIALLNHLKDGVSFSLHCCMHRFVLSTTLLQLVVPDWSKYTEGCVAGNEKMMQL